MHRYFLISWTALTILTMGIVQTTLAANDRANRMGPIGVEKLTTDEEEVLLNFLKQICIKSKVMVLRDPMPFYRVSATVHPISGKRLKRPLKGIAFAAVPTTRNRETFEAALLNSLEDRVFYVPKTESYYEVVDANVRVTPGDDPYYIVEIIPLVLIQHPRDLVEQHGKRLK